MSRPTFNGIHALSQMIQIVGVAFTMECQQCFVVEAWILASTPTTSLHLERGTIKKCRHIKEFLVETSSFVNRHWFLCFSNVGDKHESLTIRLYINPQTGLLFGNQHIDGE